MFENPRRGRQARNFTTNVPTILDLKSSSPNRYFLKIVVGCPWRLFTILLILYKRSSCTHDCRAYSDRKVFRLTPVHKKGDHEKIGNYPPLFLLSVPFKTLESSFICCGLNCESYVSMNDEDLIMDYLSPIFWKGKALGTRLTLSMGPPKIKMCKASPLLTHLTENWWHSIDNRLQSNYAHNNQRLDIQKFLLKLAKLFPCHDLAIEEQSCPQCFL